MVMLGKKTPDVAGILQGGGADAQVFEGHSLAVEHAVYIMIRNNEQLSGVGEGLVAGKPLWIGVSMGAEDRQVAHAGVKLSRDAARRWISGKQSVFVEQIRRASHVVARAPD